MDQVKEIRNAVKKEGCDVNVANPFGQRPLHIAALWGTVNAIRTLLELGAEVNAQNSRYVPLERGWSDLPIIMD